MVHDALDAELDGLIRALTRLGLRGGKGPSKLVRIPVDDNVIGRINSGRRATGVPAVQLLLLCLEKHVGRRGGPRR